MADLFDTVLDFEQEMVANGTKLGENDGRKTGFLEGQELGKNMGKDLATEVGFYQGCSSTWLKLASLDPSRFPEK